MKTGMLPMGYAVAILATSISLQSPLTSAFQTMSGVVGTYSSRRAFCSARPRSTIVLAPPLLQASDDVDVDADDETDELETFLKENYAGFYSLLLTKNKEILAGIRSPYSTYTLFAPNDTVMEGLGEKKISQLKDDRNSETTEKMSGYHVITDEAVGDAALRTEDWTAPKSADNVRPLTISGIQTQSGELRVGRSRSGGFLGFGAKEDGGIVVGNDAKILKSKKVGNSIVHEVDALVSPELLWRYFDQLRIPGF